MGFSISLHSSERRSLIYWRMPGLSINSRRGFTRHLYPPERLSLNNWCVPPASSLPSACGCRLLRRRSCAIYSSAAPVPNVRCCWCGSPFVICACQRDSRSFVCIPFQDPPRYGDLPVVKTNNPVSVQLFCDCGLSFVRAKYKRAADQPICCAFAPRSNP